MSQRKFVNRRKFLQLGAAGLAALAGGTSLTHVSLADMTSPTSPPSPAKLPRWRGFNLLEKFDANHNEPFKESDFQMLAEWGFDFVRLPMSYWCWAKPTDWLNLDESQLKQIDQAVEFGRQYKIHVNLNLHRAPGYCVNPPEEPKSLWTDPSALDACAFHWSSLAKRYKGLPNTAISFDLLNEPAKIDPALYARVVKRLVEAIRAEDRDRLIIADGLRWGNTPVPELIPLSVAQSMHCYNPIQVTHYKASWMQGSNTWPAPTWPIDVKGQGRWDKTRLQKEQVDPWLALGRRGVGIHVGEWGVFQFTPHDVALAWVKDCLQLWRNAGWGWSMWNFRGGFGPLDSNRNDVQYESYKGHQLDRAMLELLRNH